jgi:hypothetical protein
MTNDGGGGSAVGYFDPYRNNEEQTQALKVNEQQ